MMATKNLCMGVLWRYPSHVTRQCAARWASLGVGQMQSGGDAMSQKLTVFVFSKNSYNWLSSASSFSIFSKLS